VVFANKLSDRVPFFVVEYIIIFPSLLHSYEQAKSDPIAWPGVKYIAVLFSKNEEVSLAIRWYIPALIRVNVNVRPVVLIICRLKTGVLGLDGVLGSFEPTWENTYNNWVYPGLAFKAYDAVVAKDAVPCNDPVIPLLPPLLPDTTRLPVITALPLNGKPAPPAFKANDAVVAKDAVPNNEPVNEPVNDPVLYDEVKLLKEDVVTKELVLIVVPAFKAKEAVVAKLAVPANEPVNDPDSDKGWRNCSERNVLILCINIRQICLYLLLRQLC